MSVIIKLNESVASQRVVPLPPLVQSNGTSSCTNESGNTFFFSVGGVFYGSGGSISAISAPIGLYECLFSASKVSVAGQGAVHYSSGTALPARTPIEIVRTDSYDSMRYGLFALPNAAAEAAGGLITFGTGTGQAHFSTGSVGLKAQTHSDVTIKGIQNILAGTYSGVTFGVNNIAPGNYSGASFEILTGGIQTSSIGKGSYSGVSVEIKTAGIVPNSIQSNTYSSITWDGVNRINSSVTIANGTYSSVSVRVEAIDFGSIVTFGVSNIKAGSYSGVTVGIDNIKPLAYSGVTVDGAKFLSTAGERSAASSLLSTNMGSSRLLQEYYWSMRNKISISGSTATVFLPDDVTSAYTMSVTTAVSSVQGLDGGGRA